MEPTPAEEELPKKWMLLSDITKDHDIQIRAAVDPLRVEEYSEIISIYGNMTPMTVFKVPMEESTFKYLLADGFTREEAYRKAGKDKAPVIIREGSRSDALEFAISANSRHGAPLSNKDKRRAAELAVQDPVLGARDDAWIAKKLGVSGGFISTVRRGLKPEDIKKRRERKAASNPESESPAPKPATARERKSDREPADAKRPTAAACIRQLEEWIKLDVIEESEVIRLFNSSTGTYHWTVKLGKSVTLNILDKQGAPLVEVPAVVKAINESLIQVVVGVRAFAEATREE